jgi:hypothetical protein
VVSLVVGTIVVVAVFGGAFRPVSRAFVWLCAANVVMLGIDLLRGTPLSSVSIAGYGIMEGARYYGLGNELMGTMLGATLLGIGMSAKAGGRFRGAIIAAIFACVFVLIAAPSLGAKTGGALAAAPAMITALLSRRQSKNGCGYFADCARGGRIICNGCDAKLVLSVAHGTLCRPGDERGYFGPGCDCSAQDRGKPDACGDQRLEPAAGFEPGGIGLDVLVRQAQIRRKFLERRAVLCGHGLQRGDRMCFCL